jgi:signal transduction histidine kinase
MDTQRAEGLNETHTSTEPQGIRSVAGHRSSRTDQRETIGISRAAVHELRTPLTAIHGYAQLLRRGLSDPAVAQRALDVILRETTRLSRLLADLSEVAELDSESFYIDPVEADLVAVARTVAEKARGLDGRHDLRVVDDTSLVARLDPRRVAQVLAHLLSNALDYTPEGGQVTIQVKRGPEGVHMAVSDTGIGINSQEAERIYDRFYRGRDAEQSGARGLGIGLYIVREIVQRSGGRVWHEPSEGGGTTFHVTWPEP